MKKVANKTGVISRSREEWERIVKDYELSDLKRKEFCKKENIVLSTFHRWYYWVNNLRTGVKNQIIRSQKLQRR